MSIDKEAIDLSIHNSTMSAACVQRLQEWITAALCDPSVKRAVWANEALRERLFTITEVNAEAAKLLLERCEELDELADGGDAA